jgi:hypothetical protein
MKWCTKCQTDKPLHEFSRNPARRDGLNAWCRSCQKSYHKANYGANKAKIVQQVKDRKRSLADAIWAYKTERACVDCGEDDTRVLDFDHLQDKAWNIGRMVADGWSLKKIMAEIAKCEVVCANCHRKRTFERAGWRAVLASEAQLEVSLPSKQVVAGSSPVTRSR